ncbi:hypothetical protein R6Q59_008886 [Mikania micrantha]
MKEASSSTTFPQELAEMIQGDKLTCYSNNLQVGSDMYNYYQQPDRRDIGVPIQYPLMINYQSAGVNDNGHDHIFQQPFSPRMKVSDWRCQQVPVRRSQKLADKITALQKLVSPYGKTDTASVLQEAHISISLLHDQIKVNLLS